MFKLFSEDRQRKRAVLQIVRKSVPAILILAPEISFQIRPLADAVYFKGFYLLI